MILEASPEQGLPFTQTVVSDFLQSQQWSEHFTVCIVLGGKLCIRYHEETREYHPHDIYFFPPFETWTIVQHAKAAKLLKLTIDSTYISRICPEVINLFLRQNYIAEDFSDPVYTEICGSFARLLDETHTHELCASFKLLNEVHHILITIFENFGDINETGETIYHADRIFEVLNYINDHYNEKITGTVIAKHLGLHPAYFSTFFRKQFGIGFVEYLNTYRVNQSIPVLLRTDRSILEIALDHGFSNHKTYAAAFRRITGSSPTEYRKARRLNASSIYIMTPEQELPKRDSQTFSFFSQFLDNPR